MQVFIGTWSLDRENCIYSVFVSDGCRHVLGHFLKCCKRYLFVAYRIKYVK